MLASSDLDKITAQRRADAVSSDTICCAKPGKP
jgi:hypothetical protein